MRFKLFGRSGLRVSELCLGTMTFGETWGWGADKQISRAIFDRFVAQGGNFIDTANNYTDGTSEEYVGEFVRRNRDEFVIASKYTLVNGNGADPNLGGNSRKSMMRSVEASLRRMKTDYLDVLYLHMWDFMTPVEEILRGVSDLMTAGKVHYFAFSDTPAWIISHAIALAENNGWPRPVAVQLPYSVMSRDAETDYFPMANHFDLTVATWGMLNGGTITGKYNRESDEPKRESDASPKAKKAAETIVKLADSRGTNPAALAIAWVRAQHANVVPIIGARTEAQLASNMSCLDVEIDPETYERLAELADFKQGFPRSFLTNDHVRGLIFGTTFEKTINHRDVFA